MCICNDDVHDVFHTFCLWTDVIKKDASVMLAGIFYDIMSVRMAYCLFQLQVSAEFIAGIAQWQLSAVIA